MYNVTEKYSELIKAPVRYTGIRGAVRLKDGTMIPLTDSNIDSGSLTITNKLNRRGDFRPGGVYSGELSARLRGFSGKSSDLDGAAIRLAYVLYHDRGMADSRAETVPLGRYYIDGSTIKRRNNLVTFSAVDSLTFFDIPATERTGTLYQLAQSACDSAGVALGMSGEDFAALPNGTQSAAINTARIQTERDALMYIGMLTGTFARIRREDNALEFKPLSCTKDEKGMIIPVREIAGNIRFTTDFSDDTTRIAQLVTRRRGVAVTSTTQITAGGSEKLVSMELDENPLLDGLGESDVVAALNSQLGVLYHCLNRVYDCSFNGDPALDIGDYVRLRGGAIDTDRGYATGVITSQVWKYRGQHTIRCNMPSSITPVAESTEVAALALAAQDPGGTAQYRTQPRSQADKRIDALEASAGTAEKLNSPDGNSYAVMQDTGELMIFKGGAPVMYLLNSEGMIGFQEAGSRHLHFDEHGGISLNNRKGGTCYANIGTSESQAIRIETDGIDGAYPRSVFQLKYGAKLFANADGLLIGDKFRIVLTSGGFRLERTDTTCTLEAMSDGLYYNGVKIGG